MREIPVTDRPLDPSALLNGSDLRLTLHARLEPASGLDRFQPAGFPEIGHVIYDAPRPDNRVQKVCIVDSAASMANHHPSGERTLSSSHVESSLSRRSPDGMENGKPVARHEIPSVEQWWTVFKTIFRYDPNSLVHGVLFPAMGIKLPRMLTAHLEAIGVSRIRSSGVKFDKLGKTSSGQPIFSVDEETASEIIATFVVDLALLRSFGRAGRGLSDEQKEFLLALALWKIERLLRGPFRYRTNCDLELRELRMRMRDGEEPVDPPAIDIMSAIKRAGINGPPVTQVYWPADELFRAGADEREEDSDSAGEQDTED